MAEMVVVLPVAVVVSTAAPMVTPVEAEDTDAVVASAITKVVSKPATKTVPVEPAAPVVLPLVTLIKGAVVVAAAVVVVVTVWPAVTVVVTTDVVFVATVVAGDVVAVAVEAVTEVVGVDVVVVGLAAAIASVMLTGAGPMFVNSSALMLSPLYCWVVSVDETVKEISY